MTKRLHVRLTLFGDRVRRARLALTGDFVSKLVTGSLLLTMAAALAGCGQTEGGIISAGSKPISKPAMQLLSAKGLQAQSPIFVRIFKEESELEVWKSRDDGRFHHFKTYPICTWSGDLGPKQTVGDRQSPEGFYAVANSQLNPRSQFHLSFNLGYPNAYDRSLGRTGDALMVHGDCKSVGCFAMTDGLVEEIYALAREALAGGQKQFAVHIFPFRMTRENMQRHQSSQWISFWKTLKDGYDTFEISRQVPSVAVCNRSYVVNAVFNDPAASIDPQAACPAYVRRKPDFWVENAQPGGATLAQRVQAPGKKTRTPAAVNPPAVQAATPAVTVAQTAQPPVAADATSKDWTDPSTFVFKPIPQ
jgi:murein L,D-transpeptidase YafK